MRDPSWFRTLKRIQLAPGGVAPDLLKVPVGDAERILRSVVRLVADLPVASSPEVVWQQAQSELLVHTDSVSLQCASGLVTVTVAVNCDQLGAPTPIAVPLAVGTEAAPAGLIMSGLQRLAGPDAVTVLWSDAISAFAWESILELATQLCAGVGNDATGRPLVPGAIGAEPRTLLVQPMARHSLAFRKPR